MKIYAPKGFKIRSVHQLGNVPPWKTTWRRFKGRISYLQKNV